MRFLKAYIIAIVLFLIGIIGVAYMLFKMAGFMVGLIVSLFGTLVTVSIVYCIIKAILKRKKEKRS